MAGHLYDWEIASAAFFTYVAVVSAVLPGLPPRWRRSAALLALGGLGLTAVSVALPGSAVLDNWIIPPVLLADTPDGERFQNGALKEPSLEEYAAGAAALLELLPADIAVHPVTLPSPLEKVIGPPWVLNRQKVQEALTRALEGRDSRQGARA